jgi:HD-GYP domain-containing protein (c-di-GMP phosphodiesterase class II)
MPTIHNPIDRLKELNEIGIALSQQHEINSLLELILNAAKRITHADAGTLYLTDPDHKVLDFKIVRTDSLKVAMGGLHGEPITYYPVQLYDSQGLPNHSMVVSHTALSGDTVNIPDAYMAHGYDFSGTKNFDAKTGYRSMSFLTVPMTNHEREVIGVLQLINAQDRESGAIVAFSLDDQQLVESLASQAAIALTNCRLIKQLEELFESFIQLINTAIDDKSAYTGGHCERVPELTMMLADAVTRTTQGPLKDFVMTEKDRYELKIAGLLHDCGKITTPVHVVDKPTKLHTLFDRIELLDTRFEVLKRDAEIEMLKKLGSMPQGHSHETTELKLLFLSEGSRSVAEIRVEYESRIRQLDDDRDFLRLCNIGVEKMADADAQRIRQIARYQWCDATGKLIDFLSENELENLSIRSGTLTTAEREIINRHIDVTIKMLESLPWPKHLKNVPEYAAGHHERMDGHGYPRGLTREQMPLQARMMGIADIFEALTAKDRPYKAGKTLSESLTLLGKFKLNGHIDPDLFDVFIKEKIYLDYARLFLAPEQIDVVDLTAIPGVSRDELPVCR